MSTNIFGECLLGTSARQLCHKQKKMDLANLDDTAPLTPALNAKLLMSQNESLISLIYHNSQGNMVVWFNYIINYTKYTPTYFVI